LSLKEFDSYNMWIEVQIAVKKVHTYNVPHRLK
jgi:hypothetical protein